MSENVREDGSIFPPVDWRDVEWAAAITAEALSRREAARVTLCPGDATRYDLVVVPPGEWHDREGNRHSDEGTVALVNFGRVHPWSFFWVDDHYAAESWGAGNMHTGRVIAGFLNAVLDAMGNGQTKVEAEG